MYLNNGPSVTHDTRHVNHTPTFIKDRDRKLKVPKSSSSCVKLFNGHPAESWPVRDDLRLEGGGIDNLTLSIDSTPFYRLRSRSRQEHVACLRASNVAESQTIVHRTILLFDKEKKR